MDELRTLSVPHPSPARYCPIDRTFNILHPRFGGDFSEPGLKSSAFCWARRLSIGTASRARAGKYYVAELGSR